MKHSISFEWIGFGNDSAMGQLSKTYGSYFKMPNRKPWVAKIIGTDDHYGFKRQFIDGQFDCKDSSSTANRGAYLYFIVEEGEGFYYEVCYYTSWRNKEKYFCTFFEGKEYRCFSR